MRPASIGTLFLWKNSIDPKRLKRISSISKEYDLSLAYKAASYALTRDPDATWAWQILEKVVRDPEACDLLLTLSTVAPLVFKENKKRIHDCTLGI